MKLASVKDDSWELRSGTATHEKYPDTFWIPPQKEREGLKIGQAAKLMFDVEAFDESGKQCISGDRMWVIVSERIDDTFIGILDNQPTCLDFETDSYLRFGAEIPFKAEHVIDIADPPQHHINWQLGQPPERLWPRG